jgi:hypothetical protein
MSDPQMPQCEILMSTSMALNGLGSKEDQVMLPSAALLSRPSQPWNSFGDVMFDDGSSVLI